LSSAQQSERPLIGRILEGDRVAIAKAISQIENGSAEASGLQAEIFRHSGNAYSIGITGAPGAGKSTLTDRLIEVIRRRDGKVGVIAVDPTSPFTGGAILGDRVRMQQHATDPDVFIRSMATRGHLGGLALAAPQAIRVLDASGKDYVIVETVGVGQIEVEVVEAVDTTVVVVTPGWGDSIQASKAGLLEIADVFVVNKADRPGADRAVQELKQMLELAPPSEWERPVLKTVASEGEGVEELFDAILAHRHFCESKGLLDARRRERIEAELKRTLKEALGRRAEEICNGPDFDAALETVMNRLKDPQTAALELAESS
jgi:LAO/AO transport system kinase